jgi:ribosomal protein S7
MYLEKKSDIREQVIRKKENERKDRSIPISKVMKRHKKSLLRNITDKRLEYIEKLTKNMDRQVLEDTIDSWNNDRDLKPHVSLLKRQRRIIKS